MQMIMFSVWFIQLFYGDASLPENEIENFSPFFEVSKTHAKCQDRFEMLLKTLSNLSWRLLYVPVSITFS